MHLRKEDRRNHRSDADEHAKSHTNSAPTSWHILGVLSALMGFGAISTDFYLPAMPSMAKALNADAGTLEFTISGYLVGFSIGQLFWGPISDRFGRRLPAAIGLVLFIIGSAGCATSSSAFLVIAWRILQAVGACAGVVLARAMVRDLYEGPRAAQMLSTLIAVMAIAPLVGPVLGGWIATLAGWRAIFWTQVAVGFITLAALFTIPETYPASHRNKERLLRAFSRYGELIRYRSILGYVGAGGFFYAGMFAYIAGSPFAFITYYQVPAQFYGFLFGAGVLGIMTTNVANTRLVHRFETRRLLQWGVAAAAGTGILSATAAYTGLGGLWGLFVPLVLFASCTGFIVANSITGALADFPQQAGAVSALVGALQYGSGIVSSALVGAFSDGTPWAMGWVIALCGIGSLLSVRLVSPRPAI